MTNDNKPREFWIVLERDEPTESNAMVHFSEFGTQSSELVETVHVIKYSAYDELKKENELLRENLKEAVEALEWTIDPINFDESCIPVINEALAKIKPKGE